MPELFQHQQSELAASTAKLPWLTEFNQRGADAFLASSLPTRKTEAWKYTPLTALTRLAPQQCGQAVADTAQLATFAHIDGLHDHRLVFVNGLLDKQHSSASALASVTLFSEANAEQQALIAQHLGRVVQQNENANLFTDLNDAALADGVLLHIQDNQPLLQISWLTTAGAQPFTAFSRLLVVVERHAQAAIVEHYGSDLSEQNSVTNAVTEIVLNDNAQLQHYRLQTMHSSAQHIGSCHVDLQRDARYHGFHAGFGSTLCRNDLVVHHNQGGSHCQLDGIYVPQHDELIDFHTCIEHRAAHCTSNEVFRGIMNDQAKAVFNGRIHIHPHAQKTLAELSNKNLLLTPGAEVFTKPELEIYADDVKCAHGATVAQLDNKAMFYLQSRGISKADAEVMLSFGFINELIEQLPDEAIRNLLRPMLAKRFGRDTSLTNDIG